VLQTCHCQTTAEPFVVDEPVPLFSASNSVMRRACAWSRRDETSIVCFTMRGLGVGGGGLGAVMRCGRVRVAVSGITSPGSDFARLSARITGGRWSPLLCSERFEPLHRGVHARPGPYARWCLTFDSCRPHFSQAACPSAVFLGAGEPAGNGAPTQ
jgi:hypothetical protein